MADDPGKEVKKRVDAFIKGMNNWFEDEGKEIEKKMQTNGTAGASYDISSKKSGTLKKADRVPTIRLVHNNQDITASRTAEQHVKLLLNNKSWSFTSRHLGDAARHVLIEVEGSTNNSLNMNANGQKKWDPYDFGNVKKAWVKEMKAQKLTNAADAQAWCESDSLHLQLPESNPGLDSDIVKEVIELYMKATREDGKKKNDKLEKKFKKVIEDYEKKMKLTPAVKGVS